MKIQVRLEFNHIFPGEEKKSTLEYLKQMSKETLSNIIGFFTTYPLPNFDNFFTNPETQTFIIDNVVKYCRKTKLIEKPQILSIEGGLLLSELILANKTLLIDNSTIDENPDEEELSLFKAFLVINESLNEETEITLTSTEQGIEKMAEIIIALKFSTSDLGLYDNHSIELSKLVYVTSYKFHSLIEFLQKDHQYLLDAICFYFGQKNVKSLKIQVDYLLIQVLNLRKENSYKFSVQDDETISFLDSLISEEIIVDKDFLNIRNFPLYKIGLQTYAVINGFFVLDKFTTSIKFLLKDVYNTKNDLKSSDRGYFNFYNTEFSENYLMKNLLNNIFFKKHLIKKEYVEGNYKEPDYYLRSNKDIFIFEYKDVLFPKDIKMSRDISKILDNLQGKFLKNATSDKPIGIGQIIGHINEINDGTFQYDTKLDKSKHYNIYSILLLSNRLLEINGINFIFNQWFKSNLNKGNQNFTIKNLVVIDIDTLIFYQEYLKNKDKNFKNILEKHIKNMNSNINGYGKNLNEYENRTMDKISRKLSPFSSRFKNEMFETKDFLNKFSYLVSK